MTELIQTINTHGLELFGTLLWPIVWTLLKIVVVVLPMFGCVAYLTLWERKLIGWMHIRLGPNRVGPLGLLQPIADALKLLLKEVIIPSKANKVLYIVAPIMVIAPAFAAWAVVPFQAELVLADVNAGLLYVMAITSIGVYGIILAGWASNSKYAFLGAMRASAQMVSYEIAMGLSLVAVFIYAGSMSTSDIVGSQHDNIWNAIVLFPSFVIYVISMVGETNRAPFDLAEAEGELVGGFHTEYSSLKFALFFLAEYVNIIAVSALATTLFLGGYHALPGLGFTESWLGGWFTLVWFFAKVIFFFFIFMWLRATLPRLRYDQFMKFGWKVLIPVSLIWILIVATLRVLQQEGASRVAIISFAAGIVILVMAASSLLDRNKQKARAPKPDGEAPDFPIPSLPQVQSINVSGGK